ncbi:ribbon-helix-helix protein, CopG family [Patescibacteria group bacterium]|nr:MAG: ribbon-helix-helix protein, CopG family [Patescibacteria group bacterium]
MRNVVNISLPAELNAVVDREVKGKHYASKSEFFRHLLRDWMAGRLLVDLQEGEKEFTAGKAKKLKKIDELWA